MTEIIQNNYYKNWYERNKFKVNELRRLKRKAHRDHIKTIYGIELRLGRPCKQIQDKAFSNIKQLESDIQNVLKVRPEVAEVLIKLKNLLNEIPRSEF